MQILCSLLFALLFGQLKQIPDCRRRHAFMQNSYRILCLISFMAVLFTFPRGETEAMEQKSHQLRPNRMCTGILSNFSRPITQTGHVVCCACLKICILMPQNDALINFLGGNSGNVNVHVKDSTQKCGRNETFRRGFVCRCIAFRVIIVQLVRYFDSPSLSSASRVFWCSSEFITIFLGCLFLENKNAKADKIYEILRAYLKMKS